jgi:hypothetical protein
MAPVTPLALVTRCGTKNSPHMMRKTLNPFVKSKF